MMQPADTLVNISNYMKTFFDTKTYFQKDDLKLFMKLATRLENARQPADVYVDDLGEFFEDNLDVIPTEQIENDDVAIGEVTNLAATNRLPVLPPKNSTEIDSNTETSSQISELQVSTPQNGKNNEILSANHELPAITSMNATDDDITKGKQNSGLLASMPKNATNSDALNEEPNTGMLALTPVSNLFTIEVEMHTPPVNTSMPRQFHPGED